MSRIGYWLVHQSVSHLIRVACVAALIALSLMAYSVISLKPLPVIFAMSVGHGIGIFAFLCYLLAVILDTRRASAGTTSASSPPPNPAASEAKAAKSSSREAARSSSGKAAKATERAAEPAADEGDDEQA